MVSFDFRSCTLTPVVERDGKSSRLSSLVTFVSDGKWKMSAFYLDSSRRARILLRLKLEFPTEDTLKEFLALKCIHPEPSNLSETGMVNNDTEANEDDNQEDQDEENEDLSHETSLGIEAKVTLTFGSGEAIFAAVEGVNVTSTKIADSKSLLFDTVIIVRVSRAHDSSEMDFPAQEAVKTEVEITAVLSDKSDVTPTAESVAIFQNAMRTPDPLSTTSTTLPRKLRQTKLQPFVLTVMLSHALSISVESHSGAAMGQTFLSLTMRHTSTHSRPVTVTSIALHPNNSRQILENGSATTDKRKRSLTAVDMSKGMKWGYAPQSEPNLPLVLHPHEAISTILFVDATEDISSRQFTMPLTVSARVGQDEESGKGGSGQQQFSIIAEATAEWSTTCAPVAPMDAFRVDMCFAKQNDSIVNEVCSVGAPVTLALEIYNLSPEAHTVTLLVAGHSKEGTPAAAAADEEKVDGGEDPHTANGLITAEKDGYRFGVAGFVFGPHSVREETSDLLAIDEAIQLGELKGLASTKTEVRVVPLRAGTLKVPNFQIIEHSSGQRYTCIHHMTLVAAESS